MCQNEKLLVLSNFFFCHYVFEKPSSAEALESVYMRERVKSNLLSPALNTKILPRQLATFKHKTFRKNQLPSRGSNSPTLGKFTLKRLKNICFKNRNCSIWNFSIFVAIFFKLSATNSSVCFLLTGHLFLSQIHKIYSRRIWKHLIKKYGNFL